MRLLTCFRRDASGVLSAEWSLAASLLAFVVVNGLRFAQPQLADRLARVPGWF